MCSSATDQNITCTCTWSYRNAHAALANTLGTVPNIKTRQIEYILETDLMHAHPVGHYAMIIIKRGHVNTDPIISACVTTHREDSDLLREVSKLLVVEVVLQILIHRLQFLQPSTLLGATEYLQSQTSPCVIVNLVASYSPLVRN